MGKRGRKKRTRRQVEEDWNELYGKEFLDDLERVKANPFMSLASIARKYNRSREFISQMFRYINGETYSSFRRKKKDDLKAEISNMGCPCNPESKILSGDSSRNATKHNAIARMIFTNIMKDNNINIRWDKINENITNVNGNCICVTSREQNRHHNMNYIVSIKQVQKNIDHNIEILAIYMRHHDKWGVIKLSDHMNIKTIIIPPPDKTNIKKSFRLKREDYLDRWDIIIGDKECLYR